ncbi:MAG: ATP-binding cassette domain-containing protein [Geminicoccaceae bacterium]|nr:ATP-binding cassette domain-containing protein [Geminicoccaceae bacterium]
MAPLLLSLRDAKVVQADRTLFDGLEIEVAEGERICLVGRNGTGKSTLLKLLAGKLDLDGGGRFQQPRTLAAYLPQEPEVEPGATLRTRVMESLPEAERGFDNAYRADQLLAELGLDPERDADGLSGGERRRVSIARLLVAEPDILLLDEPTNHLDLPTIEWLEARLAAFRGGLVLVSHDRRFLERVSNRTWWLDRGRVHRNEAGYAAFAAWSAALVEAEEKEQARLTQHLKLEEHWLHRGVTARRKRNQGRLAKLETLRRQRRDYLRQPGQARLQAKTAEGGGAMVIEAEGIEKAYAGRTVIRPFSTRVQRGDRIGIVGPNGAGKTTLLKLLLGETLPDAGRVRHGTGLVIARYEQDRASLDPKATPWTTLCPDGGDQVRVQGQWRHVVGYLRDFLFHEEQVLTPVEALSGGERNRLLLARILAEPANLFVLDEPTNDLDLDTLDLLEDVLADYDGTLLLVSHDRDFLDRIVTSTILLEGDGTAAEYAGGYADMARQRAEPQGVAPVRAPSPAAPSAAKQGYILRKEQARLLRELDRLPGRIDAATGAIARIEADLADPVLYAGKPERVAELAGRLEAARAEKAGLEERWLELEMLKETLEDEAEGLRPPG